MAIQFQLRRGTTAENDSFVGAAGEMTLDTTNNGIRIHDGTTMGGYNVPVLVYVQYPTAANNYTWARKWSDGWVEQGGQIPVSETSITLPVEMSDAEYWATVNYVKNTSATNPAIQFIATSTQATTSFTVAASTVVRVWRVEGLAA